MKRWETPALWRWLVVAAALSFIPGLFLPYIGEEAVYTISTLEMWHAHDLSNPLIYGAVYGRPPFLNWIMLPLAELLGVQHVLIASRIVTAVSTILTGAALFGLGRYLGIDRRHTWLAVLTFLSSDALLYHGWLAYADPLFGLLTFAAMSCVLVAARRQNVALLIAASLFTIAAFLTKALTAYVFVAIVWLVVYVRHRDARLTLIKPAALLSYALAIAVPIAWYSFNHTAAVGAQGALMVADIANKLRPDSLFEWLSQIVTFPLETFCRFLPVSLIVIYRYVRQRSTPQPAANQWEGTIAWATLLNFLPYWLAPSSSIRYILPIYPMIAFCLGGYLSRIDLRTLRVAVGCISVAVVLKYIAMVWAFPAYEVRYRGDAVAVAKDILYATQDAPLYIDDSSSAGLTIAANIDQMRWPAAPITFPLAESRDGWIITRHAESAGRTLVRDYWLGGDHVYLVCSGRDCATSGRQPDVKGPSRTTVPLVQDETRRPGDLHLSSVEAKPE